MTTFAQFKTYLHDVMGAPEDDPKLTDSLMYIALCGAEDAILPWRYQNKVSEIVMDGAKSSYPLPTDLYDLHAVELQKPAAYGNALKVMLPPLFFKPGTERAQTITNNDSNCDWTEYPSGTLNLSKVLDKDAIIRVYYHAYWGKPTNESNDSFALPTPSACLPGMLYWAAAHCVTAQSTASAAIRQWNVRTDSGSPVDNVLENSAKFFRALFIDEMNRLPKR